MTSDIMTEEHALALSMTSFVRNGLKTFWHMFLLGHFCMTEKIIMIELALFFRSFQIKFSQRSKN